MKVFISADIEGVTGICHRDEILSDKPEYKVFQLQMTKEVLAACRGAIAAGAKEILVKDAHATGRNILGDDLPKEVSLSRGWSGHPYLMMDGIDNTFDAVVYIGYHSRAGSLHNPLAHSFSGRKIHEVKINGHLMSEFLINSYIASSEKVPVIFLSGDDGLCQSAKRYNEKIKTVSTQKGVGAATIAQSPKKSLEEIEAGVNFGLTNIKTNSAVALPSDFCLEILFNNAPDAYSISFYPGARLSNDRLISFKSTNYFDLLTMLKFAVGF
ncbi:MAG: M55 family metallopeptidase [Bacteriovoracaceae bacterium]|nr:M55 family metallopeptidase [Bacteriovoracaceae bacterium]